MTTLTPEQMIASNKAAWDLSAPLHRQTARWQELLADVSRPDFSTFDPTITQCLLAAGVEGKRVIQLGCNNGRETLSLFALGAADAVGVDQSAAFLEQAAELATRSPHQPVFVEADIHHLPAHLQAAFDLALITIGVLNWMPDLKAFFASVAATLRPGGRLVIYETHPFLEMFDPAATDPLTPSVSYFRRAPIVEDRAIVYTGEAPEAPAVGYWHVHTLGAVLRGLIAAGLQLDDLREFAHSNREEIYDRYEGREAQLPLCYTLTAHRRL